MSAQIGGQESLIAASALAILALAFLAFALSARAIRGAAVGSDLVPSYQTVRCSGR